MTTKDIPVRMCSSGSCETSDADIPQSDDLDAYTTAYIRRFCESIGSLLEPGGSLPEPRGSLPGPGDGKREREEKKLVQA